MKVWPFENLGLVMVLLAAADVAGLSWSEGSTWAWALGALAAHTACSHAGRLARDAGRRQDWIVEIASWVGGSAVLLGSDARARWLALPILLWSIGFALYRERYRKQVPVQREWRMGGWS